MKLRHLLLVALFLIAAAPGQEETQRWRETISRMRLIDAAITLYIGDQGHAPRVADIHALRRLLTPGYVRDIAVSDAWGHEFSYSEKDDYYRIESRADGVNVVTGEEGNFTPSLRAGLFVPWKPFEAPLAHPTGTNRNIQSLTRHLNKEKSRVTMRSMQTIADAAEAYRHAEGHYPIAFTIEGLAAILDGKAVRHIRQLDEWQAPFYYSAINRGTTYWLTSGGADLENNHQQDEETTPPRTTDDAAKDCIIRNGKFRIRWEIDTRAPSSR